MSKKLRLLAYLKSGHQITLKDSMRKLGLAALSQRIGELKCEGHDIHSTLISIDKHTRIGCYWLGKRARNGR